MAVTKAIGLGIAIVVLKILLPGVLTEIERTATTFLRGASTSLEMVSTITASVGSAEITHEPFELPRTAPARLEP